MKTTFIFFTIFFCINANKGNFKKFGSVGPFVKINETFEHLSTKLFFENYVKTKTPILMRNEAKHFKAFEKWSDQYLYEKILENDADYQIDVETEKKESRKSTRVERLEFTKFLKIYKQKDIYMVTSVPDFLKEEIQLPNCLQCGQAPLTLKKTVS